MKKLPWILAAAVLCLMLWPSPSPKKAVERDLGLDVSSAWVVSHSDSHGGFHGDGLTYTVLNCARKPPLEQLQASGTWQQFPLDATTSTLVYGWREEDGGHVTQIGPYLGNGQGAPLLPDIQNGYYLLLDRHSQAGHTDILSRGSFNFTLGVYDTDTHTLYYCKLDT